MKDQPDDAVTIAERVKIIEEQLNKARAILDDAEARSLLPDERFAVSQLARVLAELTDTVRGLLSD